MYPSLRQKRLAAVLSLLDRSILLTADRKEQLRSTISHGTDAHLQALEEILSSEDAIIASIIHTTIEQAVQKGDEPFLRSLDLFLHDSMKALRNADERMEQRTDTTTAATLLDAAS